MLDRLGLLFHKYPRQFWLMITGIIFSHAGVSMIWPFLLIYTSEKLSLPLSTVATLLTINAGTGLISSFVAGTLADRVGRKFVMNASLTINGLAFFLMMGAETYSHFLFLMILIGLSNPMYQVGADAMLADMIPAEKRIDAFAINRIAGNAAFALGAAVGGFMAVISYDLVFIAAGTGYLTYSLLLFLLARETLAKGVSSKEYSSESRESMTGRVSSILNVKDNGSPQRSGYPRVFQDRGFIIFVLLLSLGLIPALMLWMLLPVYAKNGFGLAENLYGWIPTTNALMCVFAQYSVTQITRRYRAVPILAIGIFIYAIGTGSVALMTGFWGFWLSMVILTFGELTIVPTASKYAADRAHSDLRGRYMSIYWLGWGLARAAAPLIGGYLNDQFRPNAIWLGGLMLGLASTVGLLVFSNINKKQEQNNIHH